MIRSPIFSTKVCWNRVCLHFLNVFICEIVFWIDRNRDVINACISFLRGYIFIVDNKDLDSRVRGNDVTGGFQRMLLLSFPRRRESSAINSCTMTFNLHDYSVLCYKKTCGNLCNSLYDMGFTVELKNRSFTLRLSGYFLNRCGIKSLCSVPS